MRNRTKCCVHVQSPWQIPASGPDAERKDTIHLSHGGSASIEIIRNASRVEWQSDCTRDLRRRTPVCRLGCQSWDDLTDVCRASAYALCTCTVRAAFNCHTLDGSPTEGSHGQGRSVHEAKRSSDIVNVVGLRGFKRFCSRADRTAAEAEPGKGRKVGELGPASSARVSGVV